MSQARDRNGSGRFHPLGNLTSVTAAVLLFVLFIVSTVFWWHGHRIQKSFDTEVEAFQETARLHARATVAVTMTIAATDQSMLGLSSTDYANLTNEIRTQHDIEHILFASIVEHNPRYDFEMGNNTSEVPGFELHDIVGTGLDLEKHNSLMAPVIRSEPVNPNNRALFGLDLFSSPLLERYARQSMESGRVVVGDSGGFDTILINNLESHDADDHNLHKHLNLVFTRAVYHGVAVPTDIFQRRKEWRGVYVVLMNLDSIWDQHADRFGSDHARLSIYSDEDQLPDKRTGLDRFLNSTRITPVSLHPDEESSDARYMIVASYPSPLLEAGFAALIAWIISWLIIKAVTKTLSVNQRASREAELADRRRLRAEQTLTVVGEAVVRTTANFRITYVNNMAREMFGASVASLDDVHLEQLLEPIDIDISGFTAGVDNRVVHSTLVDGDYRFIDSETGDELMLNLQGVRTDTIADEDGAWIFVIRDVGVERAMANELEWRASRDELTGLLNRHSFEKVTADIISSDPECSHALCVVDLDNFKVINDTAGHAVGDEMLRKVANALNSEVRSFDITARLGGDEFGFLLVNVDDKEIDSINERMVKAIRGCRVSSEDKVFQVGASIGIAITENRRWSVEEMLRNADSACYAAKKSGRGRSVVFRPDDIHINQRESDILWIREIPKALDSDRLLLDIQSIMAVRGNTQPREIREVLVRLISTEDEIVYPGDFIPAAERHKLMPDIDRWVIENSFREIGRIPAGSDECIYSLNLSSRTLDDPDFDKFVLMQLEQSGVHPAQICFELTETAAVSDVGHASDFLNQMRQLGFKTALDDFGSGLASFRYLRSFPADYLKLDRSLVVEAAADDRSRRLLEGVIDLARDMGLGTVAEGIESKDVLQLMTTIGVDYIQGYYISEPELFFAPASFDDPRQDVQLAKLA